MKILLKCYLLFLFIYPPPTLGQSLELPRAVPLEMETFLYHNTYIKITYSKISAVTSNNKEFSKTGQLWQLGANEPAELMTTGDLLVDSDTLKSGAYSIFAIPEKAEWTIIFNSDVGLFGTYRYNENKDIFRLKMPVSESDKFIDRLLIYFEQKGIPKTELVIAWMDKKVIIPVEVLNSTEN